MVHKIVCYRLKRPTNTIVTKHISELRSSHAIIQFVNLQVYLWRYLETNRIMRAEIRAMLCSFLLH